MVFTFFKSNFNKKRCFFNICAASWVKDLNPPENYGQVYIRVEQIESLYANFLANKVIIHPNSPLEIKSWGQKEFALLDPDNNLLTFGEELS
jgi:hypothetical protein